MANLKKNMIDKINIEEPINNKTKEKYYLIDISNGDKKIKPQKDKKEIERDNNQIKNKFLVKKMKKEKGKIIKEKIVLKKFMGVKNMII